MCVCHLDYDDRVVHTVFLRLFESKMAPRFFIAKPLKSQKIYLDELARELNLNIFTSRSNHTSTTSARLETVSSSDEDRVMAMKMKLT